MRTKLDKEIQNMGAQWLKNESADVWVDFCGLVSFV